MRNKTLRSRVEALFGAADVRVNGSRPWDIQVRRDKFYSRVLAEGSLGLGESYVDGWWECEALDQFFAKILRSGLDERARTWRTLGACLLARVYNFQRPSRAFEVGERHYDLGNDLYRVMLDRRLIYSCGYWRDAATLDEAQEAKLDLVCRKLHLAPGMRLLDIGCGWGGLAAYAVEKYGVTVVGVTVSREQAKLASEICRGLPVEILLDDYRNIEGEFDRIVSIGMFEHVGYKNYATFMRVCRRLVRDDGLFLLHTIGGNRSVTCIDPWIEKYIFPNAMLPSARQITAASEGLFVLEDWHNFGPDYDKTLMAWFANFHAGWPKLRAKYGERFYRIWKYYLLACAGSFRCRLNQLWQIVFSPMGVEGGYHAPR